MPVATWIPKKNWGFRQSQAWRKVIFSAWKHRNSHVWSPLVTYRCILTYYPVSVGIIISNYKDPNEPIRISYISWNVMRILKASERFCNITGPSTSTNMGLRRRWLNSVMLWHVFLLKLRGFSMVATKIRTSHRILLGPPMELLMKIGDTLSHRCFLGCARAAHCYHSGPSPLGNVRSITAAD